MSDVTPTARVPIPEAMLFIPPDGEDRDPDFENAEDMAAMRKIRAADYIFSRDGVPPEEWTEQPHRLYCPCCFEKKHLSRHYGVTDHNRDVPSWSNGDMISVHFPASFHKWPNGPDHTTSCDHKDRYNKLSFPHSEIDDSVRVLNAQVHTITIPTNPVISAPPRPKFNQHRSPRSFDVRQQHGSANPNPRSYEPTVKAPAFKSIEDIAVCIEENRYSPEEWSEIMISTPEGHQKLADIYFDNNKDLHDFCVAREEANEGPAHVIVSLSPNRLRKYWDGGHLPSLPQKVKREDENVEYLTTVFDAQTDRARQKLWSLFAPKAGDTKGVKVLAYGLASLDEDQKAHIKISRIRQITDWTPPSPPKPDKPREPKNLSFDFGGSVRPISSARKKVKSDTRNETESIKYDDNGQAYMVI